MCDVSGATNLAGSVYDSATTPLAPGGVLAAGLVPAMTVRLIDLNDPVQLAKFGLNNGPNDNSNTLAEKWESLAMAPALDPAAPGDFLLFIGNDNDFSTTDGFQDGSPFRADFTTDNMILVYRLSLGTRLINLSSRSLTGPGEAAHVVGFVVQGMLARPFLLRGVGPALREFGVATALADPVLRVYDASSRLLAENDDWSLQANAEDFRVASRAVGAFALPEAGRDSGLLVYLDPGAYTVHVTTKGDETGVSLAEVYEVP